MRFLVLVVLLGCGSTNGPIAGVNYPSSCTGPCATVSAVFACCELCGKYVQVSGFDGGEIDFVADAGPNGGTPELLCLAYVQ